MAAVTVGYSEVMGHPAELPDLYAALAWLPRETALRGLAFLNNTLLDRRVYSAATQASAVAYWMPPDLRDALNRSQWGLTGHNFIVFHRQQLLFLILAAIRACRSGEDVPWTAETRHAIARAALLASDFLEFGPPAGEGDDLIRNAVIVLPSFELDAEPEDICRIARTWALWQRHSAQDPRRVAVQEEWEGALREKHATELQWLVTLLLGAYIWVRSFDPDDSATHSHFELSRASFAAPIQRPLREVFRSLDILARTPLELQRLLMEPRQCEAWDFTLLRRYPLIKLDGGTYLCFDRNLLGRYLDEGIYWLLSDAVGTAASQFSARFGDAFADYVGSLLRSVTQRALLPRPGFLASPRFTGTNDEVCDFLLDYGELVVLVEVKGSLLTPRAKYSGSVQALRDDLRAKFIGTAGEARSSGGARRKAKGVTQLARSIERLLAGEAIQGLTLRPDATLIPVMVSYDLAVTAPFLAEELERAFASALRRPAGVSRRVGGLTIMSTHDVETMERWAPQLSVQAVLERHQRVNRKLVPFSDALRAPYTATADARGSVVAKLFAEATESVQALLSPSSSGRAREP